ncbi:MAG: dephospho-CoA kinase [Clostridia bacterium]|nr:dephospho-CoA kinase [Clostridia bacterium]
MEVIGLTGGIGTGKSTVTEYLVHKGFPVIDADAISHKITEKGSPALDRLREAFGNEYFTEDGELDRKKMASLVFNSPEDKEKLESIITLQVLIDMEKKLELLEKQGSAGTVFLDVPLLYESGADELTDAVWLVTADEEARIRRVMDRDMCSRDEVLDRMRHQMTCEEKAKLADEIIDNSFGRDELYNRIEELIRKHADR